MHVHLPIEPEWTLEEENELYEMANLYPEDTGLPMTIWVSPKGTARHDARVKVNMAHGKRMTLDNMAVVSIRPEPKVLHGSLKSKDEKLVVQWIRQNQAALIDYWNGDMSTRTLMRTLIDV